MRNYLKLFNRESMLRDEMSNSQFLDLLMPDFTYKLILLCISLCNLQGKLIFPRKDKCNWILNAVVILV